MNHDDDWAPSSALNRRARGRPPDPDRVRIQATSLRGRLAKRGVELRLVDGMIRWSASGEETLTIADIWATRRLSEPLKKLLADADH
jgi:hypothetical protein